MRVVVEHRCRRLDLSPAVDVDLRPVARHDGMPPLLGRLALLLVGRDLRVEVEAGRDLRRTAEETDAAGGPAPYVRERLWGDGRAVVGGST